MTLNVGIIGAGIMGKSVARALARNPQVRLAALADQGKERLAEAKAEFGVESVYTDYQEMLSQQSFDAMFIATPDWAHFEPVMACLERKIHVHVEKPLTTDERESAHIVRKVRETGLKLQVSYNHRWLAPYYATKDKIASGVIGRPLMGFARKNNPISVPTKMLPSWAKDSSPMWFQSSHDIDLMAWWLEDHPIEVTCAGIKSVLKERFGWDTYDALQGLVKFSKGAIVTFEAAWIYPETHPAMPDSYMTVVGERGHLQIDRKDEAIEMSSPEGFTWPRSFLNYKIFDRWTGAFPSCINSFIDAILEDREPFVTALDGWIATATLDALHRSADRGKTIPVAPLP